MAESMIERVAKAIYEKLNMRGNAYLSDYGDDLGDVVVDGRVDLLDIARAVIEEMRVPTDGMEDWFRDNLEYAETGVWIWKGAIDAALKEQEGHV